MKRLGAISALIFSFTSAYGQFDDVMVIRDTFRPGYVKYVASWMNIDQQESAAGHLDANMCWEVENNQISWSIYFKTWTGKGLPRKAGYPYYFSLSFEDGTIKRFDMNCSVSPSALDIAQAAMFETDPIFVCYEQRNGLGTALFNKKVKKVAIVGEGYNQVFVIRHPEVFKKMVRAILKKKKRLEG